MGFSYNMSKSITASLLVDYITGTPQRRLEIVRMKVTPHPFYNWYGAYHDPASKIVMGENPEAVKRATENHLRSRTRSKNNDSDMNNVLDALGYLTDTIMPELRLRNLTYQLRPKSFDSSFHIGVLSVSSKPDLLVYDNSGSLSHVGSVNFYLHKTDDYLSIHGLELLSAINFRILRDSGIMNAVHDYNLCYVIDALRNRTVVALTPYANYQSEIEAGVDQLINQWNLALSERKLG